MRIAGELRFREPPPDLRNATVRVRLLDVSRADAAAERVAEQTIEGPSVEPDDDGGSVRFALEAPELQAGRSYSLAAHVDLSGSGEIEPGDFLTMESVPVEPTSERGHVEVPVRPVRS
jgi:putative lipoprotein